MKNKIIRKSNIFGLVLVVLFNILIKHLGVELR
jgi:hypothetical protein